MNKEIKEKYILDLRKKIDIGETYEINVFDSLMNYNAIYRFDGKNFIRILFHKNCKYGTKFKRKLSKKEFKKLLSLIPIWGVRWKGDMQIDQGCEEDEIDEEIDTCIKEARFYPIPSMAHLIKEGEGDLE